MLKNILTVLKKEIIDLTRDKRTMITSIFIPLVIIPTIITISSKIQENNSDKNQKKKIKVGWMSYDKQSALETTLRKDTDLLFTQYRDAQQISDSVKAETVDVGIVLWQDFTQRLDSNRTGTVNLYFNSKEEVFKTRMIAKLDAFKQTVLQKRLETLQLDDEKITPLKVQDHDMASDRELFGKYFGGLLPYMFIIFCFMGCFMACLDLFTGEKERGTLETLLTSPVSRLQILIGKMSVAVMMGVLTAVLSISGVLLFVKFGTDSIPKEIVNIIKDLFTPGFIISLFAMLIPLTIFFAGLLVPIAVYAKNFREAQSIIGPLNFIIILPAMMAMMPGIKLTYITALIPVTNIALCTKYMIGGESIAAYLPIVIGSLLCYATLTVSLSVRQFSKESNLVR